MVEVLARIFHTTRGDFTGWWLIDEANNTPDDCEDVPSPDEIIELFTNDYGLDLSTATMLAEIAFFGTVFSEA